MTGRFKVTGIDLGDTGFHVGNCLMMHKLRNAVDTPKMYAEIRGSAVGWMNSTGTIHQLLFFDELFSSDVVLDHVVPEPPQQNDGTEAVVLIASLLIAFPDARFGFGLQGGENSLSLFGYFRSLGKESLDLREGSGTRVFVTRLFNYLHKNSYWVDDDLVHLLALLTDLCQDRNRIISAQVLSLSTSGNHQVDAGLFHAWQLVEALLEIPYGESASKAVERWNEAYPFQLNTDEIDYIKNLRDISLHFKPERARMRLSQSRSALGFDQDSSREHEFRRYGIQRLLREAAKAYFLNLLK